jgi:lipopolysaccharide/colanic/teichoic acid biosynthesis glycosyltransferase
VQLGLIGLAQIHDKNDDPFEKFRYDMEYLKKLGLILDVRFIFHSAWNTIIARWDHRSGKIKSK